MSPQVGRRKLRIGIVETIPFSDISHPAITVGAIRKTTMGVPWKRHDRVIGLVPETEEVPPIHPRHLHLSFEVEPNELLPNGARRGVYEQAGCSIFDK
jgi:hypothetical protein